MRRSLLGQLSFVALCWAYVVALHWGNDGLWFQGDAPRHAANGLFWWDFLSQIPANPVEFALSYYARYPVINPIMYPPVFYVLEGAAFAVFGASPFVAKALVLGYALAADLYMIAWLRRFILPAAGWAAPLLILQPSVLGWSHAVMLTVPSMALALAALYHTRRWLDAPVSRHLYLAVAFTVLAVLTHVTSALIVLVMLAWVVVERRWTALLTRRSIVAWMAGALLLLPWAVVVFKWLNLVIGFTLAGRGTALSADRWMFYADTLPQLFTVTLLGAAAVGLGVGLFDARWRREATLAGLWVLVCYLGLSYIGPREDRYLLIAAPGLVIVGVLGVVVLIDRLPWPPTIDRAGAVTAVALIIVTFHAVRAHSMSLPYVDGFQDVVRFLEREAPRDRVLYDGPFNGSFSFYVRAGDPGFARSVVAGHKLLYPSAIMHGRRRPMERVSSPADALEVLRRECGCRWVVIETSENSEATLAARHLRQAVAGPEFRLVKSFDLRGNTPIRLDVYRFLAGRAPAGDVDVRLPILGPNTEFRRSPIVR